VVTSHKVILLASGDIKKPTSVGLFPLNIYLRVPGHTGAISARGLPTHQVRWKSEKLCGCTDMTSNSSSIKTSPSDDLIKV